MSDTIDQMRKRLNAVIADASEQLQLEKAGQEQILIDSLNGLSQESAVRGAYVDGRSDERMRCLALIDDHLRTLNRTGVNALALEALRLAVEGL
jgi:hypothetical protein